MESEREKRFSQLARDELRRQDVRLSPSLNAELQAMIASGVERLDQTSAGPQQMAEAEANLTTVIQTMAAHVQRHARERGVAEYELRASWLGDWKQKICPIFPWC